MGFLDTVRQQAFRQPRQPLYKAQFNQLPGWLQATGDAHHFDLLNTPESQSNLYAQLSWIQIAIHNVATTAITSALKVKSKKDVDGNASDIANHPFEQLLQRPNPAMSRSEFVEATVSYRALAGNAYWWLNRASEKAKPTEMWIVPPQKLRPVPDGNLFIKGYLYDAGQGEEIPLETWEIVHFKRFNPANMYIGLSAVESLQLIAQGDIAAQQWNTNYFAKDNAKLPGALAFADPIDDDAWMAMSADINSNYGGTQRKLMMLRNAGKGGVQWINMAVSQREMEFLSGRKFNRDEIFNALAPGLISILSENATEANATAGKNTFIEYGVWPHLVHIAEKITNDLLSCYGDDLTCEFEDIRITDRSLSLAEQNAFAQVHTIDEIRKEFYSNDPIGDERGSLLIMEVVPLARASGASSTDAGALDLTNVPGQPQVTVAQPAGLLTDSTAQPPATPEVPAGIPAGTPAPNQDKLATGKALKAATLKAHSSGMVAFFLPQYAVDTLVAIQAMLPMNSTPTPADEFHMTLVMLGEVADLDTAAVNAINNALYEFAAIMPPLTGKYNGTGRFQGVGDGGADALYVTFDSKALQEWRLFLVGCLRNAGVVMPSEHGFIPHITLGYVPSNAVTPLIYLPDYEITFGEVWLALGDNKQSFKLNGAVDTGATSDELPEEIKRFKNWLRKRKNPDVTKFSSDLLTDERKAEILESMTVTGQTKEDGSDQPFFTPATHKATLLELPPEEQAKHEKAKLELEKRSTGKIKQAFDSMLNGLTPDGGDDAEALTKQLQGKSKANKKVKDALAEALQEGADLGTKFSIKQLEGVVSSGFDWTLVAEDAKAWADNHAGELIKQIDDTSQKFVQDAVARWFESGEPLDALSESLKTLFGEGRAELIASTEVTRASAMGQQISFIASGVVSKIIWQTTVDELVCEVCGPRNGTTSELEKPDFDGLGLPPAHPRCRCFVRASLD